MPPGRFQRRRREEKQEQDENKNKSGKKKGQQRDSKGRSIKSALFGPDPPRL